MASHYDLKNHLKVPFPSDDLVFSSSGVLFQAVGCDLVSKVGEAVPVSRTAIDPLQLQVSRYINWSARDIPFQADDSLASVWLKSNMMFSYGCAKVRITT